MEDCITSYTFTDLFDLNEIQRIQDAVSISLEVGTIITDPIGNPITKPSNFCTFCEKVVRSSEKGKQNCMISDSVLGRPNKEGPIISKCLSAGLLDAGASIMVGDTHIASWMLGQVLDEDLIMTDEENRAKAEELGINPDIYCAAISQVPVMAREKFHHVADLIFILAKQLSQLALRNLQQKEEIRYRLNLEQQLNSEREQLMYMNTHDLLTDVYSRSYFEENLARIDSEGTQPVSVVVGDVNNLKLMNDVFGHKFGDNLLIAICNIMKIESDSNYIIARCGGDEFNIIMPDTPYEKAMDFCSRVQKACLRTTDCILTPSIAFGVETKTKKQEHLHILIKHAEEKMYLNKNILKSNINVLEDIQNILYSKKYLNYDTVTRTVSLVRDFGMFLNLQDSVVDDLCLAAKIQDLGMIVVPEEIFFKSSKLTQDEWEEIYKHPIISFQLAKLYDSSFPVAKIIHYSHENWNGSGYPEHLTGQEIPYGARIINLTNAYIAMTSDKPYGLAMTKEKATQQISENSGIQFDPLITVKFIEFLEQGSV